MLTVQPLLTFAGAVLGSNPTWQKAVPYLQTLSYVAAGTKLEGSTRVSRLAIGLR